VKQRNALWNASPLLPTFHPGFAELAMHWSWYHTAGMHNYNWLASKPWKPFTITHTLEWKNRDRVWD
jgi:hypothetical protein